MMQKTAIHKIKVLKTSDPFSQIQKELDNCIYRQEAEHELSFEKHILLCDDSYYVIFIMFGSRNRKEHFNSKGDCRTEISGNNNVNKLVNSLNKKISEYEKDHYFLIDVQFQKSNSAGFVYTAVFQRCNYVAK